MLFFFTEIDDSDSDFEPSEEETDSDLSYEDSDQECCDDIDSNTSDESCVYPSLEMNKTVTVLTPGKNSKGKRSNKCHSCVFCEVFSSNIARHMSLKHQNEVEVAKILMLPKKSKERRKMWDILVKKGDFAHNYSILQKGHGILIPKYRSRKPAPNTKDYLPCQYCKGFYKKLDLWKHQKSCQKPENSDSLCIAPIRSGKLLLPVENKEVTKKLYNDIILKMRDDGIREVVEGDYLIMRYGQRLYEEQGHIPHRHQYISQKMRELGRLLVVLKSSEYNISSLEDAMKPSSWDSFIQSVKKVSEFSYETHTYGIPSLALKIGYSMKKCAEDLHFIALKNEDEDKKRISQTFVEMYNCDWKTSISAKALASLSSLKYNKTQLLPLVEDVVKMNDFLQKKAEVMINSWSDDCCAEFTKMCLAQIILFNRKRSGEAERMSVQSFHDARSGGQVDAVVKSALTEFEKHLCQTHLRVEIMGKKGRKVPVLLTKEMQRNIDTLLKKRKFKSQFLFARVGSQISTYRGSDCIREFALQCGAKNPATITSTKLRKQLATLAQVLNLKENSQDILATFQGHDIRVHREFYRLPHDALEVAKVSKLLHCVNNGTISKFKGLDFDDIQFDKGK